ncbi:Formate hydrogenlyase subunit 3/Multisubunit Na+/H+ antiporter, MnhD subunit [Dethiosulfatibacter aminovorans DSM 17477]|uniref:Formate hydrogenlyase subunit 3/Multisubunit Na+/H+ antiporter, MnhD subunit n=1 Tax=Dethiosulfatibacter aminovorans DSM 17477 TaxID=1121476 RepID=A0A1M6FUF1_9FIRM|nr:proton-conducting transporter membrane subunit [Dethiosulfatibacter aminovorans]SHJ01331.1 Formate hydrogenlyase subunit 3/Multisubunit Na+/H+ antiporter, MnhD subunit [Dethiosulfatibacter aminovorans DSM 17477]
MEKLLLFILLFPFIGSVVTSVLGYRNNNIRNFLNIVITLINLIVIIYMYPMVIEAPVEYTIPYVMGTGLHLKMDIFRYMFVFITAFVWFIINVYSSQYLINYIHRNRYYLFFMITYASTIGVFISENLVNLFTFFEIMSMASYPLIIHDEDEEAHKAGATYMGMAIAGGLILLMGIFILYSHTKSLDIDYIGRVLPNMGAIKYLISALMIIGFGVKAGMVPLHIWLPKAHPAAPTPASAVLSGILVKTGIFGIIITSIFLMDGNKYISYALIFSGLVNMFMGGYLALFQINIKKTLAYSSMSQLGYIIMGVGLMGAMGEHNAIAVFGTLFHIFNHAIFKVMLFMGVGIIYMITHKLNINEIYGFGTFKPILKLTFFTGFCAIIGLPGFNGFTSKTIIHHALAEALHHSSPVLAYGAEFVFYLSSAFTTAYLLKLYISLFVENNSRYYASYSRYINRRALFPMVISAALIFVIGIKPDLFFDYFGDIYKVFGIHMEEMEHFHYFTFGNILSSFITIGLGIAIYTRFILKKLVVPVKGRRRPDFVNPTTEWFSIEKNIYLPVLTVTYRVFNTVLKGLDDILLYSVKGIGKTAKYLSNIEFMEEYSPTKRMEIIWTSLRSKSAETVEGAGESIKHNISGNIDAISKDIKSIQNNVNGNMTTLSKDIKSIQDKFNSITYSIYLVGGFLVIVMLFVIIFRM